MNPNLVLTVAKGPSEGQTLESEPGSKIRIGRIVRGNTLSIKDAGVSSKHLAINFGVELGRMGKWTISDLGSSNGTFLNSRQLDAFTPVELSDGDVIKIGECTVIKVGVKFEVKEEKNARRGAKLGGIDENGQLELGKMDSNRNLNGRKRRGKAILEKLVVTDTKIEEGMVSLENENENMENLGRTMSKTVTRNKKKDEILGQKSGVENVEEIESVEPDEAVVKLRPRRGRGAKKEQTAGAKGVGEKQGQAESSRRVTRSMRTGGNLESLGENGLGSGRELEKVLPVVEKNGKNVVTRRTSRSKRKEGALEKFGETGSQANGDMRKGRRGMTNRTVKTLVESVSNNTGEGLGSAEKLDLKLNEIKEEKEGIPVKEEVEEEEGRDVDGLMREEERVNSGIYCSNRFASSPVVEDDSWNVDLEKMTLGEWFDYLEVYLPKQIIDSTEEMIEGMRLKAQKFHEFMLLKKNGKKDVEVPLC